MRLRLLGEDSVAFRDTRGRIGISKIIAPIAALTSFFGRNEECGLRASITAGNTTSTETASTFPSEPEGSELPSSRRRSASPIAQPARRSRLGLYGAAGFRGRAAGFRVVRNCRLVIARRQSACSAQLGAGGRRAIDYAPRLLSAQPQGADHRPQAAPAFWTDDGHPVFEIKESRAGLLIGARRKMNDDPNSYFWGITQFLFPFHQMFHR